jgi:aminoglycoside 3-N-acetyltransferase I
LLHGRFHSLRRLALAPSTNVWQLQLSRPAFLAVAAPSDSEVVGGVAGFILPKSEQARSAFCIYRLAVSDAYRRQGIATALVATLGRAITEHGLYMMFVQAHCGDAPAVALYTKPRTREDVMHFDIAAPPAYQSSPSARIPGPHSWQAMSM